MDSAVPIDPYAAPTTQVFAAMGLLWLSWHIFSFWRLMASLFILPGTSVCTSTTYYSLTPLTLRPADPPPALQVRQKRQLGGRHGRL